MKNLITNRQLVSLNTARIKLKEKHPRIADDLRQIFQIIIKEQELDNGNDDS